ncbi:MAG TPA: Ig-like domain-containing protein, partial [Thermoanaerobaculia bacterium]|nr:Ig-like domain-containing protein [Thermoanaerobaculia bacterium]
VSYRGEYHFDAIELRNGAGLVATDPVFAGSLDATGGSFEGDFEVAGPVVLDADGDLAMAGALAAEQMTVRGGTRLVPKASLEPVRLDVSGTLTVESGAEIDVSERGYVGQLAFSKPAEAPPGVTAAARGSGGSHGGAGKGSGAGEVYDSVYAPQLAGGGGGDNNDYLTYEGGDGGGAVEIVAGTMVLDGDVLARGVACNAGGGAGGAVWIRAGDLSGAGSIDASGGDVSPSLCDWWPSASHSGGGGRVAIEAATLTGFDPAVQVQVLGGHSRDGEHSAPGTLYTLLGGDVHGVLRIDAGEKSDGSDRASITTGLPLLGSGAVAAVEVVGSDLWVSAGSAFRWRWEGAWMSLADGVGADLGSYRVAAVDTATGRVLLTGAGAVTGAASYAGEYRFDRIELVNGAGLSVGDPLDVDSVVSEGGGEVDGPVSVDTLVIGPGSEGTGLGEGLTATHLTVQAGATLTPPPGSDSVRLNVPGTFTLESGATIDVTAAGYGGQTGNSNPAQAPPGVGVAARGSGGSHGGSGKGSGAGEVYDSVYAPQLAGGGGGDNNDFHKYEGGDGGGAVEIVAGTVVLDGEVLARGVACNAGGGAGGAVWIRTGDLSGAGSIDASGGDVSPSLCNWWPSASHSGGGGRVAIEAATLTGFDPAVQVQVQGGRSRDGEHSAPGTLYTLLAGDVHGVLRIDAGEKSDDTDRLSIATELPVLGSGAVAAAEVDGGDLWVTAGSAFPWRWEGTWMTLADAAGADLGSYRVAAVDTATGRVLLTGAAAVTGAASYSGEYRFDHVELVNSAGLLASDPVAVTTIAGAGADLFGPITAGTIVLTPDDGASELGAELRADSLTLSSGTVVTAPAADDGVLSITLAGTLTVAAGASIQVDALGHRGEVFGSFSQWTAEAPAGVTAAARGSGGSHGGTGYGGGAGEVYGSYLAPSYRGGGGGASNDFHIRDGGWGGGAIEIDVGSLVLEGEISVDGDACQGGGGAGGSVWIRAATVGGGGTVSADGGYLWGSRCDWWEDDAHAGGGGRVAFEVGSFDGFDHELQVTAYGGRTRNGIYAAAGTVFSRLAGDTYGELLIDQGQPSQTVAATVLPAIGRGTVGAVEVDAGDPADLWIEPADPAVLFGLGVFGLEVRIGGVAYPVLDQTADRRRVLLAGAAGAVSVGDEYVGLLRLDLLTVRGGAHLAIADGSDVAVEVVDGAAGSTFTQADLDPPVVLFTAPAAGTTYSSGDSIAVGVTVTDASTVSQVVFTFDGQSVTDTEAPWEASLTAPVVSVEETIDLVVTATDAEGNVGTATRAVTVQPLAPGDPPVVAYLCPTPGARLAAGSGLDLTVEASHDEGIEKVDFLVGDDPTVVGTDTTAPYQFHLAVPAGAVEGDTVAFRARARSFNGNTAEATYVATVVAGQLVSADHFLAAGDTSFDNASVIVAGGTLTVEGPHTFRDLVVLDGAAVTHPVAESLDLSLTRDLYVACGGAVDAGGRGWPETSFASGFTGGDLSDWTVYDVPGSINGPSDWQIDPSGTGYLRQLSDIYLQDIQRIGTFLSWDPGAALTDYRFAVRQRSDDDDGIGLVFRYQDAGNHYRFYWHKASLRRLQKRVGGTYVTLAEDSVGYTQYAWHEIEIVADGTQLQAWVDGTLVFDVVDSEFPSGTFGMMAYGNVNSIWDDLRVVDLTQPSTLGDTHGTHGGRGGGFDGTGRIYGSLFDPLLPGSGGNRRLGPRGGGVVRLAVGGDAIVDGFLGAAGAVDTDSGSHAAGGSIRLDAAAIRGAGSVDASGGGTATAQ